MPWFYHFPGAMIFTLPLIFFIDKLHTHPNGFWTHNPYFPPILGGWERAILAKAQWNYP